MEQRIRLIDVPGGRVAYATMGHGPGLFIPPGWFAQLDIELESEPLRAFYETLASALTVIRYDRLGTGLSDRVRPADSSTLDAEVQVSEILLDALGVQQCSLFGFSYGACVAVALAARRPDLIDRMILYGSYASGMRIATPAVQESLVSMLRASWGLGSRIMTDLFIPDGDPEVVRWFTHLQRESCTGDMAAALLEQCYRADVRDVADSVTVSTLVLHRHRDRVIPFESGREMAALLPSARFEALDGRWHQPWLGDTGAVLREAGQFLGLTLADSSARAAPVPAGGGQLTTREAEVLRLVAEGLKDTEIADRLMVSPHTVHRHVANVRTRLGYSSRAGAAAYAARVGLI